MPAFDRASADAALIAAHARGDAEQLARLYHKAANSLEQSGDADAACFFFTQAYVFSLAAGLTEADQLETILRDRGRL